MLAKINITRIFKKHFATLENANTHRAEFDDYLVFLILPIVVTGILLFFKILISNDALNTVIATLSILVGLLFNVVVLVFDIIKRDHSNTVKNDVLREILANIAYTILLSLIAIVAALFTYMENCIVKTIFSGVVYFLLSNFLFTVLMVLKRMFILFDNEMDEIEKSPPTP